jgi:putative hydrolase of the HAD superfamily
MAGPVEAITFDFWNTLISESRSADHRTQRWVSAIESHGHEITHEQLEKGLQRMWEWFVQRWEGNVVVTPEHAVDVALETLGLPTSDPLKADMVTALKEGFDPSEMQTADGIGEALEALRSAGLRIGIICDVGLTPSATLRSYLDHHGLLQYFDHWSFSDEVGVYKPDQRIFVHAREGLGIDDPTAMAHIGDLRRTDVAGAREAGWRSLRYTGFADDDTELPDADHVVSHHLELVELLTA